MFCIGTNANDIQQDSDLYSIKISYPPSATNQLKNDDFPELKVNPESYTSKSTTTVSYSQILQMQPTKQVTIQNKIQVLVKLRYNTSYTPRDLRTASLS